MTSVAPVLVTRQIGFVRELTLNRPEHRNAWSDELNAAYRQALRAADDDPDVRAIVLAAAGPTFCVGGDIADLEEFAAAGTFARSGVERSLPWDTTMIRKPVLAAIQGACAGIGFAHALTCDVRFAAGDARFATAYSRVGLPAESGAAWLLPRLIGVSSALDLLLSGRVVEVDEALSLGLVTRVIRDEPVLDATLRYAHELAERCSPRAMQAIKEQVWSGLGVTSFEAAAFDADRLAEQFLTENDDVVEGIASFKNKRLPQFAPLPRP